MSRRSPQHASAPPPTARPPRVVIVGGGPAGASTARALRLLDPQLADRTLLLERAPHGRDKLCGGGLTGACVGELDRLGLEVGQPRVRVRHAVFRFRDIVRRFPLQMPAYVIRRHRFDDDLLGQVEGDVEVRRGEPVVALSRRGDGVGDSADGVEVVTPQHTYRADLVIGADGVGSRVRRFLHGELGLDREPVTRLYQADIEQPFRADEAQAMTFDFSVLEAGIHGYFWTFPSRRCDSSGEQPVMNTGLMHLHPYGKADPKAVLRTTLRHYGYADADSVALHAYPELAYRRDRPIGGANVLLVGDAAGIEPLSGEGLAQCVAYGRLAAAFAQRQWRRGSTDYTGFTRFVARSTVGREMHVATRLARRLYGPNWRFWLGLFVSRPWIGHLLTRQSEGRDYLHRHLPRLHLSYLGYRLFGRRLDD